MNFKRIEICGFKSFADKLKIDFNEGITAIVGPNGCGKSNVADAIRWVLGEQSPKLLRGSNMQDVIFKGSETRKGLSFCEVALVFDNSDRIFNIDYDEVVVSRKLYRSGDREYALNRSPCLLKDITNLLHDSGIGRDGYSIIGQGKVEEIISSKPENRRAIFEEAAGIAKFKSRKEEAERKLGRTRENITRLQDIMTEIERQLTPLKRQAEDARKYLSFREESKVLEVNNYIYHQDSANEVKNAIQAKIDSFGQEVKLKSSQIEDAVRRHNDSMDTIKGIDQQLSNLRERILTMTVALEKQSGNYRLAQEKMNYLKEKVLTITEDVAAEKERFNEINTELESKQQERAGKFGAINKLKVEAEEIQNIYLEVMRELSEVEQLADSATAQMMDEIEKISDIKARASRLEVEHNTLSEREEELTAKQSELKSRLDGFKNREKEAQAELGKAESEKKEWSNAISALKNSREEVEETIGKQQSELSATMSKQASLESRNRMLKEMHAEYEGFNGTVRRLLVDSGKDSKLKASIVGVVAELIKVPAELETAIEMALGSAVQNVVTVNEDDAKKLVQHLKSNNYGRATFLPLNSLKPRFIAREFLPLLKTKGCHGIASDLVSFDAGLEPVFQGLLGGTVIVEDMEIAVDLARQSKFSFKIVTLDGDIINPAGSITGGSKKTSINNLLSREREIETVAAEIQNTQAEVETQRATLAKYNTTLQDLENKLEQDSLNLRDCEIRLESALSACTATRQRSEELASEESGLSEELIKISTKKQYLLEEIENIKQLGNGASKFEGGADAQRNEQLRTRRDSLTQQLTDIKVKIATLESEMASIDADTARLVSEQSSLSESLDENSALLAKNIKTMETAQELDKSRDNVAIAAEEKQIEEVKAKVQELESAKGKIHDILELLEEERERTSLELEKAREKVYQEEAKLSQIDVNIENMKERIYEEYELTYTTALPLKLPDYDNKAGTARLSELKKEISKLGYVNVNAIEDSKLMEERYNLLSTEMEDLTKAEEDVMLVIKDLNEQMTKKFETAFNKINTNFTLTFKQLFGGGNARLVLTEGEDILTAGVDIIAEPPGKKLQNLSLLSGGEKALTAIAILFAILRLRPMPFCLLDEIEAALDDANVERFAKYLHNFAKETQFIVITHRKPTMELADSLYGVTMEEKGVSKIVSVKLSDAIRGTA